MDTKQAESLAREIMTVMQVEGAPRRAVDTAYGDLCWVAYEETFGEEQLRKEFGPPQSEGSSWAMEEWLDRVLRIPAHAALAALEEVGK